MIHDGRFLQSEFTFKQEEKTTTGLGLIGFEPDPGTFTSVWTDSRQTGMSLRQSRDRFDGDQIVLYSGSLKSEEKDSRRSKKPSPASKKTAANSSTVNTFLSRTARNG